MASGKFVALGSVQHLKSKFLDGYTIEVNCCTSASEGEIQGAIATIQNDAVPGSRLLESHGRFLRFGIASASSTGLGTLFQQLQLLKATRSEIDTYSVSQW